MAVFGRHWNDDVEGLTFNENTKKSNINLKDLMMYEKEIQDNFFRELKGNNLAQTIEEVSVNAFDKQTGGSHYKGMKIQPMEFALANNLNYGQANAIKYLCRYEHKNGLEDLKKAIHCIELLIEYKYGSK